MDDHRLEIPLAQDTRASRVGAVAAKLLYPSALMGGLVLMLRSLGVGRFWIVFSLAIFALAWAPIMLWGIGQAWRDPGGSLLLADGRLVIDVPLLLRAPEQIDLTLVRTVRTGEDASEWKRLAWQKGLVAPTLDVRDDTPNFMLAFKEPVVMSHARDRIPAVAPLSTDVDRFPRPRRPVEFLVARVQDPIAAKELFDKVMKAA